MKQWQYFSKWRNEWIDFPFVGNPPFESLKKYHYQLREKP